MARRRGNKKRRDVERDSTGFRRVAKIGILAAGVTAGGYKFMNSEIGKRAINSGLSDVAIKTAKDFKKDLLNKPKDLRTLKNAYDRNIGKNGEIFKRNLRNRKIGKITDAKMVKDILKSEQSRDNLLREMKKDKYDKLLLKFKKQVTKNLEGEQKDKVEDIIDALFDKATEENVANKTILKHYKKVKKSGLTDDQLDGLLNSIVEYKASNPYTNDTILEQYGEMANNVRERMRKNIFSDKNKVDGTFFDKVINRATNTTPLTLGDLKDFKDLDFGKRINMKFEDNSLSDIWMSERLRELSRIDDYKNVIIDRGLRVSIDENGKKILIDNRETMNSMQEFFNKVSDTLPGKILLKNFDLGEKHEFGILHTGKTDVNAYLTGATDNIMQDAMVYLDGALYGIKQDEKGIASLDEGKFTEVREVTGWRKKVVQELLGSRQQPLEAYDSPLAKLFDINQDGSFNIKNNINRALDGPFADRINKKLGFDASTLLGIEKNPDWEKNRLRAMKEYMNSDNILSTIEDRSNMYDNAMITSIILNKNITGVSDQLLDNMINSNVFSENENVILRSLLDGSQESLNNVIDKLSDNLNDISNDKLKQMITSSLRNIEGLKDINHISMKEGRMNPLFGMGIDEQWVRDEIGQFRVEYVKELLLNKDEEKSYMRIIDSIAKNDLQRNTLRDIGMLGLFEQNMNLNGLIADDISSRFEQFGSENTFRYNIQHDLSLKQAFNDIMDEAINSFSPINKSYLGGVNETGLYNEYNNLTFIRKSKFNPKQLVQGINDFINDRSVENLQSLAMDALDMAKGLGKELLAGRYDTENITEATLLAQYSMSRLNYSLAEFGLNLSSDSMSSPLATYLNFGLKRVAPIAFGVGAFNYLNDESRRFTGSSIVEAGARGLSYVDIGARKFAYSTPFGGMLNNWAETSVIHEYYFGSNHFDTAEEREEWYENGYSPVRKGRYWSFGSSSEYRGGAISYWQPNYLRRAESNYHDISVYGSSEEKWAHSWIPTPTHPFSTVRAVLNPYWLEKKHLKEGDRPYPVTAKMFSEDTPWGAVLNPTVGEILKPVRMLPEARLRLGHNGRDSKAVINRINERLKNKERNNEDLLIVSGTDIRNAEYIPYGNPVAGEMNFVVRDGQIQSPGYNFVDNQVPNIGTYAPPIGDDYVQQTKNGGRVLISQDSSIINSNILNGMTNQDSFDTSERLGKGIINQINNALKNHKQGGKTRSVGVMNDSSNSTYVYRNLTNEYNNYIDNWYGERYDPKMINNSRIYDFGRDAMYSASQISGIYGYLGNMFTGADNSYTFRYENAGQMATFSRRFWDASIGGLGAGPMEIARRFFPSQQKNRININPLVNNMPDWMPDSYKTGDPYTNIPKGEARLPGKGYEALNDLHPDQFGDYGAFDRYKILADVAPNSREYKIWRNIAKNTVTNEELKAEMKQIAERTAKMSGNHEFFEYKYMRNNTEYSKGIVESISGTNIKLTDNTIISLAGIEGNNKTETALENYLQPGQEITYRHDKVKAYTKENPWKNYVTPAVVYMPKSGESLNRVLIETGDAEKDVEDNSTIASLGRISAIQEFSGAVQEAIAHAPIPIVHNKFLRVDSAYESYMKETYYGSNFKTWDHPIQGFVKPMFNEQSGKSLVSEALSLGIAYKHFTDSVYSTDKKQRWISNIALISTNPTAFLGGNINYILNMSLGGNGSGQELNNWQKGALLGTVAGTVKYAWDNADNPFKSMAGMAMAGATLASRDLAWDVIDKYIGKMTIGKGTAIGAGIGLAMSMIKNPDFDKDKMFGKWAPADTRKKWELDEYFDRLEYMKYSGLYERAAALARRKEKVDIEGIFDQIDKNKKKINKLNVKSAKLVSRMKTSTDKYAKKLEEIDREKRALEEQNTMMFEGGEYTKSAVAYKKAMESTMYGLDPTATKDELLASVPDQYKDYFQAFMDVTDKKERKKILKSVSPMMRRPLQAAWGMDMERIESNRKYFRVHAMPGVGWRGWRPNVNLKYVKMKTVENEGMLLSDFGYYESEKSKVTFEDAPDIKNYNRGTILHTANIKAVMKGHGLHVRNVSIEKTRAPGIRIIGDVKEKAQDRKDNAEYKISKLAYHLGTLF
ncbi:MAG: hypothetical protein ACI3T9_02910 [Romboutsia timonensis]